MQSFSETEGGLTIFSKVTLNYSFTALLIVIPFVML